MTPEERKSARLRAAKWAKENPEKNREKQRRHRAYMLCGEREPSPPRQQKQVSAAELERRKQRSKDWHRDYYKQHRAKLQARQNELRAVKRGHVNALYRLNHKRKSADPSYRQRRRDYVQRFRENNPDSIRKWRDKNRDKLREYNRAWNRKTRAMKKAENLTTAISKLQQIKNSTPSKT